MQPQTTLKWAVPYIFLGTHFSLLVFLIKPKSTRPNVKSDKTVAVLRTSSFPVISKTLCSIILTFGFQKNHAKMWSLGANTTKELQNNMKWRVNLALGETRVVKSKGASKCPKAGPPFPSPPCLPPPPHVKRIYRLNYKMQGTFRF